MPRGLTELGGLETSGPDPRLPRVRRFARPCKGCSCGRPRRLAWRRNDRGNSYAHTITFLLGQFDAWLACIDHKF